MKKLILYFCIVQLSYFSFGQYNYVPNPGFEEFEECPTQFGQIERCFYWYAATAGSSDFLLNCDNGSQVDLPVSYMGNQEPHSGQGYGGIIIYSESNFFDYKEYLQIELKSLLIPGMPYKVSYYCSLADYVSTYASQDLEAVLTPAAIGFDYELGTFTLVPPGVKAEGFIQNTFEWVKIEGSIMAFADEKYLTIGSFIETDEMEVIYLNPGGDGYAYYFIDDVSVVIDFENELFGDNYGNGYNEAMPGPNAYYEDGCLYDVIIPNVFTPQGDGINDNYFIKYAGYIKSDIVIINRWGQTVFTSDNFLIDQWNGIGFDDGNYFYALNVMKQNGQYDNFTGNIQIIGN